MLKNYFSYLYSKKLKSFWTRIGECDSEVCLILGSGTSLRRVNLQSIGKIPLITCNSNIFLKDFNKLNCILVNTCDPWSFFSDSEIFFKLKGYSKINQKYTNTYYKEIKKLKNIRFMMHFTSIFMTYNLPNVETFYLNCFHGVKNRKIPFKFNFVKNYSGAYLACLTGAYLAGFKKCYVLGFDGFTLKESSVSRFYDKENFSFQNKTISLPYKRYYEYLEKQMKIKVLTLPGQSSLIDSTKIDAIFDNSIKEDNFDGLQLLKPNKRKLMKEGRDEWLRLNYKNIK